jgi:hypothetical protein
MRPIFWQITSVLIITLIALLIWKQFQVKKLREKFENEQSLMEAFS